MGDMISVYGKRACACIEATLPYVERDLRAIGAIVDDLDGLITQGAYNTSVSASGGTHAKGGVWDVKHSLVDTPDKLRAWRRNGWAMSEREEWEGPWKAHGHGCVIGCPHLQGAAGTDGKSWVHGALKQVEYYRLGLNGLANKGPDRGPRVTPILTWQQVIAREEADMALSADDKAWLMRQLGIVPSAVWSATWGTDTAGARLARAAEAGPATRPLTYGDRQVSLREVLGQTSAQVAALSGQIAGLTTALGQIAGGTVDLAAVEAAAKRGAEQALAGAKVTLELGDQ